MSVPLLPYMSSVLLMYHSTPNVSINGSHLTFCRNNESVLKRAVLHCS